MNTPLVTWSCIVSLLLLLIVLRLLRKNFSFNREKHNKFIQLGSESEEFFVPGDTIEDEDYEY
jgi:hypothetical protein